MKDPLKRFVRDNREAFDRLEPSSEIWERIEQKLPSYQKNTPLEPPKVKKSGFNSNFFSKKWYQIAASIALFLLTSVLVYRFLQPSQQPIEEFATNPKFAKLATQYTASIELKRQELKKLANDNPDLYHSFDEELKNLELSYTHLKNQLPQNPNQEELLQEMIKNLQWQLDVLNQQLMIIQKIKDAKNGKAKEFI